MPTPPYLARIYADSRKSRFLGTGVLVSRSHLLSCRHVVYPLTEVTAIFGEGPHEIVTRATVRKPDGFDTTHDLALLDLDRQPCDPPPWSNEPFQDSGVDVYGFERGQFRDIPGAKARTQLDTERRVVRVEVSVGVPEGMSGGVAVRLIAGVPHCVAMVCLGGEGASQSVLRGGGVIAPFLAGLDIPLPGWPAAVGKPAPPPDPSRYLDWLRKTTARIDIRGFADTTKAHTVPIGDIYIALRNGSKEELETSLSHRCLVIQGDAGSGKSTFLQYLAHRHADGKKRFPISLRVVDLDKYIARHQADSGAPVSAEDPYWIALFMASLGAPEKENWGLPASFFEAKLRHRDTLVLLDGLDETPDAARRKSIADLFARAAERYPCAFVLTTRPGAYTGDARPRDIATDSIAPLEDEAVERFLADWSRFVAVGEAAAERHRQELSEQVNATGEIRQMASSPMMLTALAVIHWNEKRLPDDRAELYATILKWMARSRETRPGRASADRCLELLRQLAFGMQTRPEGRLKKAERSEAREILAPELGARGADAFLDHEELDSGIVVSRGTEVEFRHLTFQEYLAAKEFCARTEADQRSILRSDHRHGVEWREFLSLTALCLKPEPRRLNLFFEELLNACGPTLQDRARTVALLHAILANLRGFEPRDGRYQEYVRDMVRLFDPREPHAGLDMGTRAAAAEAWERLDDVSRLPLPGDPGYWVRVGGLDIGKFPVTVYEFERFVAAGGRAPDQWEDQRRWRNRPVVRVGYERCVEYCRWVNEQGKGPEVRLPTEEEWYLAAAGPGKREYPWGPEEPDDTRANFGGKVGRPTPVGLFPAGATPGPAPILDLAGNVWEYTSSDYSPRANYKALRGASYHDETRNLRASVRALVVVDDLNGFRCVRERHSP